MNPIETSALLRTLSHGLAAIAFGVLAQLYFYAYSAVKRSRILFWLAMLFTSLAFSYVYMAFASYTSFISTPVYQVLIAFIFVPSIIVAIIANKFRKESLRKESTIHEEIHKDIKTPEEKQ